MPELPDVAIQAAYLEEHALHRPVRRTEVRDARLLADVSPDALARRLKDHPLTAARRHGKHLLVRAGASGWLALHFGMTGYLARRDEGDAEAEYARVVRTAARHRDGNRLDTAGLPRGWLLPRRDEGADCPAGCGGSVRKVAVSGRSTYLCPRCQERPG